MVMRGDIEPFDVSLVICTFNRAQMIGNLLESIEREAQHSPDCTVQVIIVNNGSTDNTGAVCTAWAERQNFSVELVDELEPGLGAARTKGLACVKGRIVAMTDDDCTLAENYFSMLVRSFATHDRPAIMGGRVELGDERDLPISIVRKPDAGELGREFPGGFLIGANLTFHRDVLALIGPFDRRFGAGGLLRAGEETEWLLRASQHGIPILYDPTIVIHHFHGRRDIAEARRLYEGYIEGTGGIYAKHLMNDRRILRWIAGDIRRALRDLVSPTAAPLMGVDRVHAFKLKNVARGFITYMRAHLA